jgi:hypothetical protein
MTVCTKFPSELATSAYYHRLSQDALILYKQALNSITGPYLVSCLSSMAVQYSLLIKNLMDFWCSQKSASEKRILPSTPPLLIHVRADLWVFLAKAKRKKGGL